MEKFIPTLSNVKEEREKHTTAKGWNLTLRSELRSNPNGVAKAVTVHSLKGIAACSIRVCVDTRHHKWCTNIEVTQLA